MIEAASILIDGVKCEFTPGETVLNVAKRNWKFIPTLCWDKRLDPMGSCRLCVVQVKGRPLPAASCTLKAEPGMEITTATSDIDFYRKTLLEMVLSEIPDGECPRCRDIGKCELHMLTEHYSVSRKRFVGKQSHVSVDDTNPFLLRDYDRCISCYRCVRICGEIEADFAITAAGRGFETRIATPFDKGLMDSTCTLCGQCIYTCPTGALADKKMRGQGTNGKSIAKTKTICPYCGTGCQIFLHVKEDKIVGVTPDYDGPANEGALCVKGQFGFDFVQSPDRLKTPLISENGRLREATWDEALTKVAAEFTRIKNQYGPNSFYGIASGRAINEADYLLQKFMRTVIGTNNVDNCSRG